MLASIRFRSEPTQHQIDGHRHQGQRRQFANFIQRHPTSLVRRPADFMGEVPTDNPRQVDDPECMQGSGSRRRPVGRSNEQRINSEQGDQAGVIPGLFPNLPNRSLLGGLVVPSRLGEDAELVQIGRASCRGGV